MILDVVYNHTAEGNQLGPDAVVPRHRQRAYYRLDADNPRHYVDYTGTGNTLNLQHPRVLQLIMDSLRYWVTEMHVDGFRFDLASTLGARPIARSTGWARFFDMRAPGPGALAGQADRRAVGPRRGRLPGRQLSARLGRVERQVSRHHARVLEGRRRPHRRVRARASPARATCYGPAAAARRASINFVTAHDGFTLHDLVSYNDKHNEANGEDNRDGEQRQPVAGTAASKARPTIRRSTALREQQKRNLLATLLLSQGVPMLLAGDEMGRTQQGNNNAYCQDNGAVVARLEARRPDAQNLLDFTHRMIALRHGHPLFRRRTFFHGRSIVAADAKDIVWLKPDGQEMTGRRVEPGLRALPRRFPVRRRPGRERRPRRSARRRRPPAPAQRRITTRSRSCCPKPRLTHWVVLLDTAIAADAPSPEPLPFGAPYPLQGRSLAVLCSTPRRR